MAELLIVEDDVSIREILHMHLSLVGHSVREAQDAAQARLLMQERLPQAGLTLQPQVQGRAVRIECNLRFADQPGAAKKWEDELFALAPELAAAGAYFDRPYGRLTELVYNEPLSLDAMRRIKKIFDPDNILNPGKLCF